jgi:hypothetical protein
VRTVSNESHGTAKKTLSPIALAWMAHELGLHLHSAKARLFHRRIVEVTRSVDDWNGLCASVQESLLRARAERS